MALIARANGAKIAAMVGSMRGAQLEPSSVVAIRGEDGTVDGAFDLAVVFEGFAGGVDEQFARLRELADAERLVEEAEFWRRHDAVRNGGPLRLRLGSLPSRLPALEATIAPLLGSLGGSSFAWYATLGLGFVAGVPSEATAAALASARGALAREGGWVVVEAAPDAWLDVSGLDPWGSTPEAFGLMQQLKQRFDPQGRLNPGCFVGGL
jgi:glycolate oxidase FAD binding subunit